MSRAAATTGSFVYLANKSGGGRAVGIRRARSERALAEALRRERQVLQRTWKLPVSSGKDSFFNLSDQEALNTQLATLLSRGVPLVDALEVASTVVSNKSADRVLRMRDAVASGKSFAEACEQVGAFDEVAIAVYRAGERTGDLAGASSQLGENAQRIRAVAGKAITMLIYPIVVLSIAAGAVLMLLTVVVPMIGNAMITAGVDLPLFTRIVLAIGLFIRGNALILLAVLAVALVLAVAMRSAIAAGAMGLVRRLPGVKAVIKHQELARFFSVMGAMTRSGIPLADALAVSTKAIGDKAMARDLTRLRSRLVEGGVFRTLVERVDSLPQATRRLLIAADQGGELDSAFNALAKDHAHEVDTRTGRLMAVLEPLLIVILFAIIGVVIVSVMLPMFTVTSQAL
ncbi:MAG: type II secretion system F family protein [Phycisphaerales bacterium]|nr:type II secretion system F family protein [Planctomycetota bacterium]MCH8508870.1 type II secretion system F family protein [Phycisphaerales bacterium]